MADKTPARVIRKGYDPHERVQFVPTGESLTRQSFNAEADINTIMKRYEKSGLIDHVNEHQGSYGDFTNVQDYHSSLNQALSAKSMFMSLPASIRNKFQNDPGAFLEFANDPENEDEMRSLGLLPAEQATDGASGDPDPDTGDPEITPEPSP